MRFRRLGLLLMLLLMTAAGLSLTGSPVAASAEQTEPPENADDDTAQAEAFVGHAKMFGCSADDDCVAVPRAGCCRNGLLEAVNKCYVAAYRRQNPCRKDRACPLILIKDRRLPSCDLHSGLCELVYPLKKHP